MSIGTLLLAGIDNPSFADRLGSLGYRVFHVEDIASLATINYPCDLVLIDCSLIPSGTNLERLYFLNNATPVAVCIENLETISPTLFKHLREGTLECLYYHEIDSGLIYSRIDKIVLLKKINAGFRNTQETIRAKMVLEKELSLRDKIVDHQRIFTEHFIESLRSGLIILDISGITILVNDQARHLLRLTGSDFTGINWTSFIPDRIGNIIERLIPDNAKPSSAYLVEKVRIDETLLQVSAHTMVEKDGTPIGIIIFLQDITEQENMTLQLYRAEKLATVGTMLSGISHELRNPLSIISARAQRALSAKSIDCEAVRTVFESIERQATRCATIVNDLLDFTRHRATSLAFHAVADILDEALAYLQYQNIFHNINVVKRYEEDLEIYGDRSRLVQVMLNIINNAADAMEGKGILKLTTGTTESQSVKITISDTGPGIEPSIQQKLFDPFFTTKDPGKGTGLGLAIVHKIVVESGGDISLCSQPGNTSFTITLPSGKGHIHE
ncbi:MAG: PAS domain-containing protein [Chitinivibrionales bacterium]|nr:PAS domain-containing protein [Chitinivibrionales bacterium]